MIKTDFFITVRDNGKTTAQKVTGYYEYMAGLPIGLHKVTNNVWNATELSTGLMIATDYTRAGALNKAVNMADLVLKHLNNDKFASARDRISEAYKGGR